MRLFALVAFAVLASLPAAPAAAGVCGQPLSSGDRPTASDSLHTLKAVVGAVACDACTMDVDGSGAVTLADSLRMLRAVVGFPLEAACPPCEDSVAKNSVSSVASGVPAYDCEATFSIAEGGPYAAVLASVDTGAAGLDDLQCSGFQLFRSNVGSVAGACSAVDPNVLMLGFVDIVGLTTPGEMARCTFTAVERPTLVVETLAALSPQVEPLEAVVQADVECVEREPPLQAWWVYATYGLFPQAPLQSFDVSVYYIDYNYGGSQYLDSTYCDVLVDGPTVTHDGESFHFDFPQGSPGYTQSQSVLRCSWYTHEPASPPDPSWFVASGNARDAEGNPVLADVCLTAFETNPSTDEPWISLCGDADSNGRVGAADALAALRWSTGIGACRAAVCDVDRSGDTTAADALQILKAAVGIEQVLLCAGECF